MTNASSIAAADSEVSKPPNQAGVRAQIRTEIGDFRKKLLDLSLRNPLLSFSHREPSTRHVRIIDELPDQVFGGLLNGTDFGILPLSVPRTQPDDEDTEEFQAALADLKGSDPVYLDSLASLEQQRASRLEFEKLERRARDRVRLDLGIERWTPETDLSPEDLARRRGLKPDFDLPTSEADTALDRHQDEELQTLHFTKDLDAKLRGLRERARASIRESGVPILFAAFGFLEWYETDESDRPHHAPLILVPLDIDRRREGQRYRYFVNALDEVANRNITLEVMLRQHFGLVLPELSEEDTPEIYFGKVQKFCEQEQPRWRVRRFLTIGVFPFSKIALYEDLDLDIWPSPDAFVDHASIQTLVASAGDAESPYAEDYTIDNLDAGTTVPPLIYDADSSQHSAIVDVLNGNKLAIHGPPGTGKSQTITNIIGAALFAGRTVLFVAEKEAALDVVNDRLSKAGLGNFCLNLHARNIRKSAVLASFKQRLEMARPGFDQSIYETQCKEWQAHRDALKLYAVKMGDPVGNLHATVHDVLWQATRVRKLTQTLPRALARMDFGQADRLTPRDVQATKEALDAVEARYKVVAQTVPDMSNHPWRGVGRLDLTPLDETEACQRAEDWSKAVAGLREQLEAVFGPKFERTASIRHVRDLFNRIAALPNFPTSKWPNGWESLAEAETRRSVMAFADALHRLQKTTADLQSAFPNCAPQTLNSDEIASLFQEAYRLEVCGETVAGLKQQISGLRQENKRWEITRDALRRLREALGLPTNERAATADVLAAVELICATPREILLGRTEALVDERAGPVLREARDRVAELQRLRDKLGADFHLADLPPAGDLRANAATLREGGLSKIFDCRRRKDARLAYKKTGKRPGKPRALQMAADFDRLADYVDLERRILSDAQLSEILGAAFKGADTNFERAMDVADWAGKVVAALPGLDPLRRRLREAFLKGDITALDEARVVLETIPSTNQEMLRSECLSEEDVAARVDNSRKQADELAAISDQAHDLGFSERLPLTRLEQLAECVKERADLASETDNCEPARELLGDTYAGSGTNPSKIASLIGWLAQLDAAGLSDDTCSAILAHLRATNQSVTELKLAHGNVLSEADSAWMSIVDFAEVDVVPFWSPQAYEDVPLEELEARAACCTDMRAALSAWRALQAALKDARDTKGAPVVRVFEDDRRPLEELVAAFEFVLYGALARRVFQRHPELQRLTGRDLENHKRAFAELDEKLLDLERRRVAHKLFNRQVDPGIGRGFSRDYTERALIHNNVALKRSRLTVRDLLRRAGKAARQLKPCFMMSPVTVAQFLPRDVQMFDLVIIDEASQVTPEDAFGAIARARQCVIVGDPQQLPPTRFFTTAFWATPDDDAGGHLFEEADSILDLALRAFRPTRYLRWHYRSQHSALINFSNHHFYDDQLIVFPAANENDPDAGVRYERVVDGAYAGHLNPAEAETVVQAALSFMNDSHTRNLSLGVVAINQAQRDLLLEKFDQIFVNDRRADGYRRKWDGTLFPFFVKNLENVQGDERDAIFISMVYGPDPNTGQIYQRFGPITHQGGHRRLNVLFTRARRLVRVFSSMSARDIIVGPQSSEGVRILRAYLDYAATGRLEARTTAGTPTESPFEVFVKARLEAEGFEVDPQVGAGGYRIDLGVQHPDYPHGYILGVECDGATYHAAKSVRDRDRLRQKVLEGLGWEIYRIWSTDWFSDPDRKFARLLAHLKQRLDAEQAGAARVHLPGVEVHGAAEETRAGYPTEIVVAPVGGIPADREALDEVVEVGDIVYYRRVDPPDKERCVQIVDGPEDSGAGVINDSAPLARALLGCAVGEQTTVEIQRRGSFEVEVLRIERPESPSGDAIQRPTGGPDAEAEMETGVTESLDLYVEWSGGQLPDPRKAPPRRVADALFGIIETEGPVPVARSFRIYARACGLRRTGQQIQLGLDRALLELKRGERVILQDELREAIVRVAGTGAVRLRERGSRTFEEIPPSEIAEHLRRIKDELSDYGADELYRELLDRYGLVRMTAPVRARLDRIARELLRGGL